MSRFDYSPKLFDWDLAHGPDLHQLAAEPIWPGLDCTVCGLPLGFRQSGKICGAGAGGPHCKSPAYFVENAKFKKFHSALPPSISGSADSILNSVPEVSQAPVCG